MVGAVSGSVAGTAGRGRESTFAIAGAFAFGSALSATECAAAAAALAVTAAALACLRVSRSVASRFGTDTARQRPKVSVVAGAGGGAPKISEYENVAVSDGFTATDRGDGFAAPTSGGVTGRSEVGFGLSPSKVTDFLSAPLPTVPTSAVVVVAAGGSEGRRGGTTPWRFSIFTLMVSFPRSIRSSAHSEESRATTVEPYSASFFPASAMNTSTRTRGGRDVAGGSSSASRSSPKSTVGGGST